jgi:hypothetical protein
VLPAAVVRWYFSAQLRIAPKLAREGAAIAGRVVSFVDGGGKKYITISWDADGREHRAKLQATGVSAPIRDGDAVTVLVTSAVKSQIGVVLGDNGFYVADGN